MRFLLKKQCLLNGELSKGRMMKIDGVVVASRCYMYLYFHVANKEHGGIFMFKDAIKNLKNLKAITGTAVLASLHTVLHFFTTILLSQTSRITLGFLTFALCGYLYGPILAGLMGIIVDLLNFAIKNDGGAFFVGFTFNNFLTGFLYGLFLFKKKLTFGRILAAVVTVNVVISLGLTPLWLSVLYGKGYLFYVSQRLVRILITIPIEATVLFFVLNKADEVVKKMSKKSIN